MSPSQSQLAREAKDAASVSTGAGPRPSGPTAATAWDRKHRQALEELEAIRRMNDENRKANANASQEDA